MGKVIAVCSNIQEFDSGSVAWNDREVWQKYPGSGWVRYLDAFAKKEGFEVLSGLEAFYRMKSGQLAAEDIYIIQEEENELGLRLWMLEGCNPSVVFCLESPLFAPFFYDRLKMLKQWFPYQVLFGELGNVKAYFPSFDSEIDLKDPIPWEERSKLACMVTSNKHYEYLAPDPRRKISPTWEYALSHQLHDLRYQVIEKWVRTKKQVDLYGHGWGIEFPEIPRGKKMDVIRDYKFCFCIENLEMPGYVTEKIIEALVAGCIPIYKGDPEFEAGAPFPLATCSEEIEDILNPKNDPLSCAVDFERCQKFVRESDEFRKFSYQSFAKTMLDCVLKTVD